MAEAEIRCTRVDPPAKPSRQELLLSLLQECPRSGMGWEQVVKHVETALTAWEADTPAPTYRIELDAETFEALIATYDGVYHPEYNFAALHDLIGALKDCANGPNDGEGLAEVDVLTTRIRTITWGGPVPEVVTLCGSTRFMQHFVAENRRLSLAGNIVISLGLFGHREGLDIGTADEPSPVKVMLDELHKRKIDLADRVHVINVGGYIGSSTRSEIDYAEAHGIPVTYMENEREAGTAGATDSSGKGKQGNASDRYADIGDRTKDGVVIRFEPGFGLNVYIEMVKHQGDRSEVYKSVGLSDTGWEKICDAVDEWRRRNDNAPNRCPGNTVTAEELAEYWHPTTYDSTLLREIYTKMLAKFFPEHIAKPAVAEPVAVERCGGLILDGYGSRCVRPKGHPPIDGIGCRRIWCPEDGPEPTEPVVYGGDGTVPHG